MVGKEEKDEMIVHMKPILSLSQSFQNLHYALGVRAWMGL